MMKRKCLLILFAIGCLNVSAQYSHDYTRRMSPGVIYKEYSTSNPARNISVMEVSLSEPTVKLQVVKSSGVINGNPETVSEMYTAQDDFAYHDVTAGINADFFTSNLTYKNPRHMMIGDGEILWDTVKVQSVFGITENDTPFIDKITESYSVSANGSVLEFDQINRARGTNQLVLYNRFTGTSTGTSSGGTEVKIVPLGGTTTWKANATIACKVLAKSGTGNMSFSAGEAVLSGVGTAKTFLDNVNVNDTISLSLDVISSSSGLVDIKQLTGGYPRIVLNGNNYAVQGMAEEGSPAGTTANPRTGIGFNQDKSKIYMVVVDGRDPGVSEGMTLSELADFMIYIDCYQALNLDGGGSSTMVGNGELKNNPSDGQERDIASALLAYLTTLTLDDFEDGVGHFYREPTYSSVTVGISTSSVAVPALTAHSGDHSLILKLYDDPSSSSAWHVKMMSGSGVPSNNRSFAGTGTLSFYMKTSTAVSGAKMNLRIDDSDGTEISPSLDVINDGQWHKYIWSLSNFNGTSREGGNGEIDSANASLDAIEFSQSHSSSTWFIFLDDLMVDKNSSESTQTKSARLKTPLEIPKDNPLNDVIIYPNPNDGRFTIDFGDRRLDVYEVEITNASGGKVFSEKFEGNREAVITAKLLPGLHIVKIRGDDYVKTLKIIIN